MANTLYPKGKEKFLVDLTSSTIKAVLVKDSYTYSASHEFLSDLGANTIGTAQTLASKTVTNGIFDAADITFPTVTTGNTVNAIAIYKDTGVAGTSPLIDYIDTVTGLPLTTSGADVDVQWDNGAYRIFSL